MKVKNIMFSGFMAVILSGVACSADAAGFQVASKQYVDAREDAIETAYKAADAAVVEAQAQVDAGQNTEIAKKADKATTLAGYGITDAYTKAEVDAKFENIDISNIDAYTKAEIDEKLSNITAAGVDISEEELNKVRAVVRTLQPEAKIIETNYSKVDVKEIMDTNNFDFEKDKFNIS